jgi:hypothetical protein
MFKKYTYDAMKGLLETWMEHGTVADDSKEEESTPSNNSTQSAPAPTAASNSTTSDVKDAFEDLFKN